MNLRLILHIFRKDGLEILRDKRTLFVNIGLPVLLYPLIALFVVQMIQLTRAQHVEPARIAGVEVPAHLGDALARAVAPPKDDDDAPRETPAKTPAGAPGMPRARTAAELIAVAPPLREALQQHALELDRLTRELERQRPATGAIAPPPTPELLDLRARQETERTALLDLLRDNDLAVAVIGTGDANRVVLAPDDANRHVEEARRAVERALEDYHRGLVVERLGAAGLGAEALRPLERSVVTVAPVAESIRTRLAGMIPLLLVMLAISGAFYPALDLIAGERERGTLESLMSWPVARRDIFLGKLLVTCAAAAISVILNLLSLALTAALAGSQIAGGAGAGVSGMLAVGGGTLLLSFLVLVPITITLAALSLALAGLAASSKEAQNYLSPLLLVVMVAAGVAATPDLRPSLVLDLVPITGSVLVLKESLAGAALPVFHLAMASAASLALAAVVVSWAARLLDSERFRYPGLVRAGWGRFRRWGLGEPLPNGLEVMAVFAIAVGGMTFGAGAFMRWQHQWVPLFVAGPLLLFVALPALAHCWLGAYRARELLQLAWPRASGLLRSGFALPFAVLTSIAIGSLQPAPPPDAAGSGMLEQVVAALRGNGLLVELLCLAVIPGICEELLCRGTLLTGLRRSLGDTGGVLISAFLFATLHLSPYRFLPQFTLGIFLALLTLRTRSLLPAILLHAGHNALAVLLSDHHDTLVQVLPEPAHRLLSAIAHLPAPVALAIGLAGLVICTSLPRRTAPAAA